MTTDDITRRKTPGSARSLSLWHGLIAGCFAVFAWAVLQFHQPGTGFSSLIVIGDALNRPEVSALRNVPHYTYQQSYGYDGAYYVQLALYPTLESPELAQAIDDLPYRARRILFSWMAWALGLGQPAWIIQAHALLNVACWFGLGLLLLRWFPPTGWQNFLRWFSIMFSSGACMSVRMSLVDLPTLLLIVWAMRWIEERRAGVACAVLALAGLGKETGLFSGAAFGLEGEWRSPRTWLRLVGRLAVIALPLAAWMAYIRWKFGPGGSAGFGNFTLPLAGLVEKWDVVINDWLAHPTGEAQIATGLGLLGVTVQFAFLVTRWRPTDPWWRVGAAFAGLMAFLATPVWEGYPGAFGRVLLPMTAAFNIMAPRARAWLPLLLLGNLSALTGWREFTPPKKDFFEVHGPKDLISRIEVMPQSGWYGPERNLRARWRWTSGMASLVMRNESPCPLNVTLRGEISSLEPQAVSIAQGDQTAWTGEVSRKPVPFEISSTIARGETVLRFAGQGPPQRLPTDPRLMAISVYDLDIEVAPADSKL